MEFTIKKILRKLLRIYPILRTRFYSRCNRYVLSIFNVNYGKGCTIYDRFYLTMHKGASLTIGDNFLFTSGDGINPLCRNIRGKIFIDENASIIIGNNVGISSASLWAKEHISIGNNVNIGGDCILMDTDVHNLNWRVRNGSLVDPENPVHETKTSISKPIVIEDDVLIGVRCIVLKGVTIGARSIVAAGSIVTKSIPPDCIAGGNPCKVIKHIDIEKNE